MPNAQARISTPEDGDLKRWEGSVELGYTDTTGNTEDTSLKTAGDVTFRTGQWRNVSHIDTIYNESEGNSTAEKETLFSCQVNDAIYMEVLQRYINIAKLERR
jgi:putative salt-induced outer membrane protein YdiY